MRLRKIFLILTLLLTALISTQMVHTLMGSVTQLKGGADGINTLKSLRLAFVAAEMASRERSPANGVLRDDLPNDPSKLARLKTFRQNTDAAFMDLEVALQLDSNGNSSLRTLSIAKSQLLHARKSIDFVASLPRGERTTEQVRGSIAQMVQVIDVLSPMTLQLTNAVLATYPKQKNLLVATRAANDLREYAGRLGSYFTVATSKGEKISRVDFIAMEQLIGQIDQLRAGLLERIYAIPDSDAINTATGVMLSRYFETAIPYVKEKIEAGLDNADFIADADNFGRRYVADMDSIVTLRNVLIDEAYDNARIELAETQSNAYWIIAWTTSSILLLAVFLLILKYRIDRPMRQAVQLIFDIADGKLDISVPQMRYRDEIAELLNAITILRDNSVARVALEDERQRLLYQLKEQATTDYLTELPNRRGFFELAEPEFYSLLRQGHPISIAIYDIDHFKKVNDTYGHEMGDIVLRSIGSLSRNYLRKGDLVARYGGEEFLLLMPYCDLEAAARKAEKLRALIEQMTISLPNGHELKVTASFGIDQCIAGDESIQDSINRCDEKLYLAKRNGRNKVVFLATTEK